MVEKIIPKRVQTTTLMNEDLLIDRGWVDDPWLDRRMKALISFQKIGVSGVPVVVRELEMPGRKRSVQVTRLGIGQALHEGEIKQFEYRQLATERIRGIQLDESLEMSRRPLTESRIAEVLLGATEVLIDASRTSEVLGHGLLGADSLVIDEADNKKIWVTGWGESSFNPEEKNWTDNVVDLAMIGAHLMTGDARFKMLSEFVNDRDDFWGRIAERHKNNWGEIESDLWQKAMMVNLIDESVNVDDSGVPRRKYPDYFISTVIIRRGLVTDKIKQRLELDKESELVNLLMEVLDKDIRNSVEFLEAGEDQMSLEVFSDRLRTILG